MYINLVLAFFSALDFLSYVNTDVEASRVDGISCRNIFNFKYTNLFTDKSIHC